MNKKFIPSLIIFFKGFLITCLGIAFYFMKTKTAVPLMIIGGILIFASFVVLIIMHSKKK